MKKVVKIEPVELDFEKFNVESTMKDITKMIVNAEMKNIREIVDAEDELFYTLTVRLVDYILGMSEAISRFDVLPIKFIEDFLEEENKKFNGDFVVAQDVVNTIVTRILIRTRFVSQKQYESDKHLVLNRDFIQNTNMTAVQVVNFAVEEILRNEKYRKLDNDASYMNIATSIICGELSRELRTLSLILDSMCIVPSTLDIFKLFTKTNDTEFRIGEILENQMLDIHEEKIIMDFLDESAIQYVYNNFDETQFETPRDYHQSQVMQTIYCVEKKVLTKTNFSRSIYKAESLLPRSLNPSIIKIEERFQLNVDKAFK